MDATWLTFANLETLHYAEKSWQLCFCFLGLNILKFSIQFDMQNIYTYNNNL